MIGRRMIAAGVVAAAVAAGGVAGAVIGIPGLSGASSSPSALSTAAQSSSGNQSGRGNQAGPHIRGFVGGGIGIGADQGVLDAAAKSLKLSTQQLLQKLSDGKTTIADVAQQQNVKLHDVIDAMEAVANTDISNLVNNPFPTFPHFRGKGPRGGSGGTGAVGPGGPAAFPSFGGIGVGGPMMGGLGFGVRGALGGSVDAVANALGISSKDLMADLAKGQSIADIAKSKGIDLSTLIKTLVTDAQKQIDAAVKAGHVPQAIATKLGANLKQLITNAVSNTHASGGLHFGGFGRHGGRGGQHGQRGSGSQPAPASPGPTN